MSAASDEALRDQYKDFQLLRRILQFIRPYRAPVALSVALLFAVSLLNLAGPYLTKIAIDDHIKPGRLEGLNAVAAVYLGVLVLAFLFQFAQTYLMQYIGQRVMFDMRTRVFAHLHRMSFRFFDNNPIGKLVTRVVNDVEVLNEMLTSGLILIFNDVFSLLGIFVMMFYLDWRLTLVICLVFPLLYMATQAYRTRARDALRKNRAHQSGLNTFLEESLSGMATVQLHRLEASHARTFEKKNSDKLREDLRSLHYNAIYLPSIDLFSALGIGLVIWYGGGRFVQSEVELGVLVAFLQYLQKFFDPIRDLAEKFNIIQTAMASSERVFELLDTPEDAPESRPPNKTLRIAGGVEFDGVSFAYKKGEPVLKNVSFRLEAGESLAVVGATGSGKSTLINLLGRYYEADAGRILIDGVPATSLNRQDLRRQMALVQQDIFLFSGSVGDNIRLGNPGLGPEEVEAVARTVRSYPYIQRLPYKFEQDVKERGVLFSQGERQLISFARALAADPRILILDEATASVDSETEREIQLAMRELVEGRTSIIIAHRLSTLKHVDKVLVLKNGEVAEFGTRAELLSKKGIFYRLMQLQAKTEPAG